MSTAVSSTTAAVGAAQPLTTRGRTQVTTRALTRVIGALAATALGVSVGSISVALTDHNGSLAVSIRGPIRVVSLARAEGDDNAVLRTGGTVLERAARAQQSIKNDASGITGSVIDSVTIRLTGVDIQAHAVVGAGLAGVGLSAVALGRLAVRRRGSLAQRGVEKVAAQGLAQ